MYEKILNKNLENLCRKNQQISELFFVILQGNNYEIFAKIT